MSSRDEMSSLFKNYRSMITKILGSKLTAKPFMQKESSFLQVKLERGN